jgi:hypothetical protein
MKLNKRRNRSNITPDLFDSLQTLWDRFASGFICLDEEEDELIVNCPSCNEDYNRGRGKHVFCDECRPTRKRPPHGLRLVCA